MIQKKKNKKKVVKNGNKRIWLGGFLSGRLRFNIIKIRSFDPLTYFRYTEDLTTPH